MAMMSWLTRWIEGNRLIHGLAVRVWRLFPPRFAGWLKAKLARSWVVGAVAVMLDESVSPPEVLLVEHSYRPRGAWGLPGGSLDSIPGNPSAPREDASPDDVIEATLRREVAEELGIAIGAIRLLRVDAVPFVVEEPGAYRLDFYFLCEPEEGFAAVRDQLARGTFLPISPEISSVRLVGLPTLRDYDLYSPHGRLLMKDLPRLRPRLAT